MKKFYDFIEKICLVQKQGVGKLSQNSEISKNKGGEFRRGEVSSNTPDHA